MSRNRNWNFGQVTRHSLVLVVTGLSFIAMGVSFRYYVSGTPRWEALVVARNVMSIDAWSWVFITAGSLVVVIAHWPDRARIWGYSILTGLSLAWSAFYFMGTFFADSPGSNLSTAFVWGLQAFVWWAISGLPDVTATRKGWMPLWTGSRKSD